MGEKSCVEMRSKTLIGGCDLPWFLAFVISLSVLQSIGCECKMSRSSFAGRELAVVRNTEYGYMAFIYTGN